MSVKFQRINAAQYTEIIDDAKQNAIYVGEIDGKEARNLDEYLEMIWKAFQFPDTGYVNYHAYMDWICDLSWLNANGYILVFHNFDKLLAQSSRDRQIIIESIDEDVLPWWEGEVERCVVGGKAKPFNVYLVD